jgi:hypothetical protein
MHPEIDEMNPCLKSALLAVATLVFTTSNAHALSGNAVNNLGLLAEQISEVEFWSAPRPRGHYTDTWILSVGHPSTIVASVLSSTFSMRHEGVQLTGLTLFADDYRTRLAPGYLYTTKVSPGMESFLEVLGYLPLEPGRQYFLQVQAFQWTADAVYGGTIRTGSLIPEPTSMFLAVAGLGVVAVGVQRRRRAAARSAMVSM